MSLEAIILAAGQGTRMRSTLPKVLHPLAGKPMLQWAVDAAAALDAEAIHVVVGHGAEQVKATIHHPDLHWAHQAEQNGTGHAVAQAISQVKDDSTVLVSYGDVPLISAATLQRLLQNSHSNGLALLTAELDDPSGYGRIVRGDNGRVLRIVEQKDAGPEQLAIREINTGILAAPAIALKRWLPALKAENAQGEYYLTDIIAMAVADGFDITVAQPDDAMEIQGVNSRLQLQQLERAYQCQQAEQLMAAGVSLADAARLDVRGELRCGQDVFIDVNCIFEGAVELAANVSIGPNCLIINSRIAAGAEIKANSIVEGAEVGEGAVVGPFARLRPGTALAEGVKVGNFVEVKKSRLASGSKVNHLSYIGDAEIGRDANVGAGTITCNYDGVNKHQTQIGEKAFIGSNTSLVAPVVVGAGATVGAGSTITGNIADGELAVARGKQRNIQGWKRPSKKS